MKVTIIADASHCPQTGAAGYGFWIASERGKKPGGGQVRERVDCSSAAEMIAIVNAAHHAVRDGLVQQGDHILFQTDCQSAIRAFSDTRAGISADEQKARAEFFRLKREHGFTHSFRHVKGHTKRPEARYVTNNLCDARAKRAMRLARQRFGGL